jgi:hypothetical protein
MLTEIMSGYFFRVKVETVLIETSLGSICGCYLIRLRDLDYDLGLVDTDRHNCSLICGAFLLTIFFGPLLYLLYPP